MLREIRGANHYSVVHKIADGGMGSVYLAIQHGTAGFQKMVAIKTLLPEFCDRERFVKMFVEEAKLVADLVHENIVQIYQLGRSREGYFIVMELVRGLSLHDLIRGHVVEGTFIPRDLAVFIASRIARGLDYAHTRVDAVGSPLNIVHRDVCPSNVLITTEGLPKLTDFGVAVFTGTERKRNRLVGKFHYMAPEQAQPGKVDSRADVYALGAVFFEMLCNDRPRSAEREEQLLESIRKGAVDWHLLPKDLPTEIVEILQRCLAPQPEDRWAATGDLAKALEYFIYKDGYGPTTKTLEAYLRSRANDLFEADHQLLQRIETLERTNSTDIAHPDATILVD